MVSLPVVVGIFWLGIAVGAVISNNLPVAVIMAVGAVTLLAVEAHQQRHQEGPS